MPEHSSDSVAHADGRDVASVARSERAGGTDRSGGSERTGASRRRSSRRTRRTDWRLGGRTVLRWRENLLAVALIAVGAGILAGFGAHLLGAPPVFSTLLIWGGMAAAIALGFARSRPIGLLRLRPVDLLWAVGLGLLVRLVQGWTETADGGVAAFPTFPTVNGALAQFWWFDGALAPVVIAPVVEELFFRGIVLVSLFTVLRRPFGSFTAGLTAWLVTTGLFVAVHAIGGDGSVAGVVATGVLGGVCGMLVLLTGRIWGAVGVHLVYNLTGVVLALAGTWNGS